MQADKPTGDPAYPFPSGSWREVQLGKRRAGGQAQSPGHKHAGRCLAQVQPIVVEPCYIATETTSRKTLERLETFWVAFKRKRGGQDSRNLSVEEETKPLERQAWASVKKPAGQGLAVVGQEAGHVSGARPSSLAGQTHLPWSVQKVDKCRPWGSGLDPLLPWWALPPPPLSPLLPTPIPSTAGPPSPAPSCPAAPAVSNPEARAGSSPVVVPDSPPPGFREPICLLRSKGEVLAEPEPVFLGRPGKSAAPHALQLHL